MRVCTLLTDFGLRDWYLGVMKGTLLRLAPGTVLVDLGHQVDPGDVATAALLLAASAPVFPEGTVHLAVVDPGVGSSRRMLAARVGGQVCVAPDNGLLDCLLAGATDPAPGARAAPVHAIERPDLYLESAGETFHGRDRFAPVAAALLVGASLESLGPPIDDPVTLGLPPPAFDRGRGRITGRVVHVDRYGNLITDVPVRWIERELLRARVGTLEVRRRATHYAEVDHGEPALVVGSLGTLELALRDQSAAAATGIARGAPVTIDLAAPER